MSLPAPLLYKETKIIYLPKYSVFIYVSKNFISNNMALYTVHIEGVNFTAPHLLVPYNKHQ